MAAFCYEDDRGYLTGLTKARVATLNKLLAPWYSILGQISTHKRLQELGAWRTPNHGDMQYCVYARVNLQTQGMYIGETGDLTNRIKQHYFATCKHRHDAPNPCRCCREHNKYKKHRTALPHEWITIPVTYVSSKLEAKRLESKMIQILKPSLNAPDKPFWLLKDTYAQQYKHMTRNKKDNSKKPWAKPKSPALAAGTSSVLLTTYTYGEHMYVDFAAILRHLADRGVSGSVTINPGRYDVTKWARVRDLFGTSTMYNAGVNQGSLQAWVMPRAQTAVLIEPVRIEKGSFRDFATTFQDIADFQRQLRKADDEDLSFYWRVRHDLDKAHKYKARKLVWDECKHRYGVSSQPIELRIPYFEELNAVKVRAWIQQKISSTEWPAFIKAWHVRRIKIITESQPSISNILCNVNRPTNNCMGRCCCDAVEQRLRARGYKGQLPRIDGHIFGISRDYDGPHADALNVSANNIPQQTRWDLQRAWERMYKQLPPWMQPAKSQWDKTLRSCTNAVQYSKPAFTTTRAVYTLRKDLHGLIIGEVDKNPHELSFCCPVLYREAWAKAYNMDTGYANVYPVKTRNGAHAYDMQAPQGRGHGHTDDIIKTWERTYRRNQWNQFATYDKKGSFNRPYILFKAKNLTDLATREDKWHKARPIAPQTKHPMRRLFHLTGRAWSFITSNIPGEHFVLNHSGQVPAFLQQVERQLGPKGPLQVDIKDIEGCFPNMDKDVIRLGLAHATTAIRRQTGHEAVYLPARGRAPCQWRARKGYVKLPFTVLHEVMNFALENTLIVGLDGQLMKQVKGIPMGDPHSPGMTIGACAWMEQEWLHTMDASLADKFLARRYMDDVLMFSTRDLDTRNLLDECYLPPLRLEDAGSSTFLETSLRITPDNQIVHWLKNENFRGEGPKVWRYAHFHSHTAFTQKRAVLTACLKKVHFMASNDQALKDSAIQKLCEFRRLQYPRKLLWSACTTMGVQSRNPTWFDIRDTMP